MQRSAGNAHWYEHVNAVNPSVQMRDWLIDRNSLTRKLMDHCNHFRVQRLRQERARCLADEGLAISLTRRVSVREREVLLRCDEVPVVFAHTIVPLSATASDWPFFSALGDRSLGTTLFGDPQVSRGALQFARLHTGHPLARRAHVAVAMTMTEFDTPLYARRCLFKRKNGLLLVTEIFLPTILKIKSSVTQRAAINDIKR